MKVIEPILKIGNFGLHSIKSPSGHWIYVGTVPVDLDGKWFHTYDAAKAEALDWAKREGVTP